MTLRRGDMTQGVILRQLAVFAVPIMLGYLLQQLYNAFDAIVVGNFVSQQALAAVGSSGPLMNMIIAFFMGMSSGSSVLVSQYYGARDVKGVQDTVHTAMLLAVILGVVLSAVGVAVSPTLLRWMATPEKILTDAVLYLRINFAGLSALTVYNMGAAILTASGDAKRPLYFLIISSVLNILGNLWFVIGLHMGIAGVAASTVAAEIISAALVIAVLCRAQTEYKMSFGKLRLHPPILKRIAAIGLPGGIQQAIISVSNIVVQSYINRLGASVVAGYIASSKLDAFIQLPTQTMGMAATTFVGQNLGAGQPARARRGVNVSLLIGLAATAALSLTVLMFQRPLLRIFTPDPEVLAHGFEFIKVFAPTYIILTFTQILPGALRGAGDVRVATLTTISCYVLLRQVYLYFVTKINYSIVSVALGYPFTWAVAAIIITVYYFKVSNWSAFEAKANEQPE